MVIDDDSNGKNVCDLLVFSSNRLCLQPNTRYADMNAKVALSIKYASKPQHSTQLVY